MSRHRSFELFCAKYLEELGYTVEVTPGINDWGVDIFAIRNKKKFAVQVKMYGTSKTKISRKDVFELRGVSNYFDCHGAIILYNGTITEDAKKVAEKLGIELLFVHLKNLEDKYTPKELFEVSNTNILPFNDLWDNYIKPLKGKSIQNQMGLINKIKDVTDGYILKVSSNEKNGKVKIDEFKWAYDVICNQGHIYSIDIRDHFKSKNSSFVTLVFDNIDLFEVNYNPRLIKLKK